MSRSSGPCCCSSYVQASMVLGILCVISNLLICCMPDTNGNYVTTILVGVICALINGLLIYGAATKNDTAIVAWMVFAIIEVITQIIVTIAIFVMLAATLAIVSGDITAS